VKTTLRVNGTERAIDVPRTTTLLSALRDDLGLTGTRFGCGSGQCGACFVLVDGRAVASCLVPVEQSASWTLLEELHHRDGRVANSGWDSYPIATFRHAPESIEVEVIGDPTKPSTGVGEPGAVAISAAIGNAVFAATGVRVRELPMTPGRVPGRAAR
jgi:ferredoxin